MSRPPTSSPTTAAWATTSTSTTRPVPETLELTLAEVMRCTRAGITINTFLLDPDRGLRGFVDQLARINRGRTFATTPENWATTCWWTS